MSWNIKLSDCIYDALFPALRTYIGCLLRHPFLYPIITQAPGTSQGYAGGLLKLCMIFLRTSYIR